MYSARSHFNRHRWILSPLEQSSLFLTRTRKTSQLHPLFAFDLEPFLELASHTYTTRLDGCALRSLKCSLLTSFFLCVELVFA